MENYLPDGTEDNQIVNIGKNHIGSYINYAENQLLRDNEFIVIRSRGWTSIGKAFTVSEKLKETFQEQDDEELEVDLLHVGQETVEDEMENGETKESEVTEVALKVGVAE